LQGHSPHEGFINFQKGGVEVSRDRQTFWLSNANNSKMGKAIDIKFDTPFQGSQSCTPQMFFAKGSGHGQVTT